MCARRTPPREHPKDRLRARTRSLYREAIVEAAEQVFAERGFAGTRMADVAGAAGIATGTLYNYFKNKQEVLGSLIELRSDLFLRRMDQVHAAERDPIERIGALVRAAFEHLEAHRAVHAIFHELGAVSEVHIGQIGKAGKAGGTARAGETGGFDIQRRYSEYVALYERSIAEAARAGRIRDDVPAAELAAFLTGAMNGLLRAWLVNGHAGSLSARANTVMTLFLAGARKNT
jgi:AcrR family transcriptional regulator